MKNIKSINEFFGPFKKKSEFDKIAIEFINRMSKVKDYTNPYEIVRDYEGTTDIFEHLGIVKYQIQFDDVYMEISNKTTVDLPKYNEYYELRVDDEEIECDEKYSEKLFKIIDSLYGKYVKKKEKEADIEKKRSDDERASRVSQNINRAADLLGESREEKKPKSVYFTKRIQITKMDLDAICNELSLPFDQLKFLSSGSFGNAYKVGDKVLKITTDKREAKTVYELLDEEQNESVIKYYDVSRYKLKNSYVYVIVMDYAKPLAGYLDEIGLTEFVDDITGVFFTEWGKLDSIEDYIDEILEQTGWEIPKAGFGKIAVEKLWKMYENLNYLDECPDFHIHNIGIKDNKDFVMFDFCDLGVVNKFDQPRIIASKGKMESLKYIEPIDEFFGLFAKDDEEDKIALEFIKRLEKVKDVNPYTIESIKKGDLPESFKSKSLYDRFFKVLFDDVVLISAYGFSFGPSGRGSDLYKLMIDDEEIHCKSKYSKKIFNLVRDINSSEVKRAKLSKLRDSINPAADALEEGVVNEFFGLTKTDEDKIAIDIINRLNRLPEDISIEARDIDGLLVNQALPDVDMTKFKSWKVKLYDRVYTVRFDDITLYSLCSDGSRYRASDSHIVIIDDLELDCKERYSRKIYKKIDDIFNKRRVSEIRGRINTAANVSERAVKKIEDLEEYRGLPSDQEEDLREIFFEFIANKEFTKEEAWEYFQPKSQTFANFLVLLEEETDWFDYTQMDEIFQEISIYIEEMDEDDVEWDDNEH